MQIEGESHLRGMAKDSEEYMSTHASHLTFSVCLHCIDSLLPAARYSVEGLFWCTCSLSRIPLLGRTFLNRFRVCKTTPCRTA